MSSASSSSRTLAVLLIPALILLGLFATWLFSVPWHEDEPTYTKAESSKSVSRDVVDRDEPKLEVSPPNAQREDVSSSIHDTSDETPSTPDERGITLRVLDAEGQPIGNVPVAIYLGNKAFLGRATWMGITDSESGCAFAEIDEFRFTSKREAIHRALIDLPLEPAVQVELGATVPEGETIDLVLPDKDRELLKPIRVRVENSAGKALANWPVKLMSDLPNEPDSWERILHVETDEKGIAAFERQTIMERQSIAKVFGGDARFLVEAQGPFYPVPHLEVDVQTRELLTLRLPPSGRVVAHLLDSSGRPFEGPATCALSWRRFGETEYGYRGHHHWRGRPFEDGVVVFEPVGLGMDLGLYGDRIDKKSSPASVTLVGPSVESESVEVNLTLGNPRPFLGFRLVDESGNPLSIRVGVSREDDGPFPSGPIRVRTAGLVSTDDEGRGELVWTVPKESLHHRSLLFIERAPRAGGGRGWVPRFGKVDEPNLRAVPGVVDLGDIVMRPKPVLVSGRVIDQRRLPVKDVRIRLQYFKRDSETSSGWYNVPFPNNQLWTNDDGRFSIHGLPNYEKLKVSAWSIGSRKGSSESVEVSSGSTDVTLVYIPDDGQEEEPAGRVLMDVLVDEGITFNHLEYSMVFDQGEVDGGFMRGRHPTGPIPADQVDVVIKSSRGFHLARIQDVVVRPGEITEDPRLLPLDLRGQLGFVRCRLVDTEGRPVVNRRVRFSANNKRRTISDKTGRDGRVVVLVRPQDAPFELHVGERSFEIRYTPEELELIIDE